MARQRQIRRDSVREAWLGRRRRREAAVSGRSQDQPRRANPTAARRPAVAGGDTRRRTAEQRRPAVVVRASGAGRWTPPHLDRRAVGARAESGPLRHRRTAQLRGGLHCIAVDRGRRGARPCGHRRRHRTYPNRDLGIQRPLLRIGSVTDDLRAAGCRPRFLRQGAVPGPVRGRRCRTSVRQQPHHRGVRLRCRPRPRTTAPGGRPRTLAGLVLGAGVPRHRPGLRRADGRVPGLRAAVHAGGGPGGLSAGERGRGADHQDRPVVAHPAGGEAGAWPGAGDPRLSATPGQLSGLRVRLR